MQSGQLIAERLPVHQLRSRTRLYSPQEIPGQPLGDDPRVLVNRVPGLTDIDYDQNNKNTLT